MKAYGEMAKNMVSEKQFGLTAVFSTDLISKVKDTGTEKKYLPKTTHNLRECLKTMDVKILLIKR